MFVGSSNGRDHEHASCSLHTQGLGCLEFRGLGFRALETLTFFEACREVAGISKACARCKSPRAFVSVILKQH